MDNLAIDCHPNPSDPARIIDTEQGWIVAYWAEHLGVSREQLLQVVELVGCEVDRVRSVLRAGKKVTVHY